MEFLLWHGLAITTVIAIAFMLGFLTGKQLNEQSTSRKNPIEAARKWLRK